MFKKQTGLLLGCLLWAALLGMSVDKMVDPKLQNSFEPFFCATIDQSHVMIKPADCNANNGAIVDLVGNSTGIGLSWTWYDNQNNIVGTNADLNNVPAGLYRVTLSDDTKCPAATATFTIGVNNTVIFDNSTTVISSPTCNQNDGSITNITIGGSPTSYQWISASNYNIILSTKKDLTNVGPGTYILTATNAQGCMGQGRYTIDPGDYAPVMDSYTTRGSDCKGSGTFQITFSKLTPASPLYMYALYNSKNQTISEGAIAYNPDGATVINATGLAADTYQLVTIGGRCITTLVTFKINQTPFLIDTSQVVIRPNVCGRYVGVINDLHLTGTPPLSLPDKLHPQLVGYYWLDAHGTRVGATLFLSGVPSGYYSLYVVNNDLCVSNTVTFFIPDSISTASRPQLNDVKMCLPGVAVLDVLNKDPNGHYQLLDSAMNLIDTSIYGVFARKVNQTTVFYVQSVNGICPSPLGKVTVEVVNPGVVIPNAFTPNGDGINDLWGIAGLENYPGTEVSVFNRIGDRVYHSVNYSNPFDGRYNGKPLPDGVYYYIVDTKKPDCSAGLSGSLTIIR